MATAKIEHDVSPLAKALVAFQKDLPSVSLDGDNPHFKSKFTTLSNLTGTVIPKLAENGLSYSAAPQVTENGFVVEAHLIHESGERLTAQFPVTETNPQKIGSAITYARRYLLASLTGVVAETDDDGNAASNPSPTERKLNSVRKPPAPIAKANTGGTAQAAIREWIGTDPERKEQANALVSAKKADGLTGDALYAAVSAELAI